jgi:anhydro-N-acetylmuramic acid kinase
MLAIGLMSGTSLDGVDAALIETDGEGLVLLHRHRMGPHDQLARRNDGWAGARPVEGQRQRGRVEGRCWRSD